MDAEDLEVLAAVARAAAAGETLLAVQVGLDRAAVADAHVADALAGRDHFDAQLVARDARVAVERHLAQVAGNVRPADPDAVDADDGVAEAGTGWFSQLELGELAGLFEDDGFHAPSP